MAGNTSASRNQMIEIRKDVFIAACVSAMLSLLVMALVLGWTYRAGLGGDGEQILVDGSTSTEELLRLANLGNPTAQRHMGERYRDGQDTRRDFNEAFNWYEKAAQGGDMEAQR